MSFTKIEIDTYLSRPHRWRMTIQ